MIILYQTLRLNQPIKTNKHYLKIKTPRIVASFIGSEYVSDELLFSVLCALALYVPVSSADNICKHLQTVCTEIRPDNPNCFQSVAKINFRKC